MLPVGKDRGTIHVVTRVRALPEKTDVLRSLLQELVEVSLQEPGCLRYSLLQNRVLPEEFVILEEWRRVEDVEAHWDSPHIQEAFLEGADWLAAPPDSHRYYLLKEEVDGHGAE